MNTVLYSSHTDEAAILMVILQQSGCIVRVVREINSLVNSWSDQPADFVLISKSENGPDLLETVRQLRALTAVPMLVIADPLPESDHVTMYEAGADVVVIRPYGIRVVVAAIKSLIKRSAGVPYFSLPTLNQGGLALDPAARSVRLEDGVPVRLTQLEFRLLYTLMTHSGQIIPSERIVDLVWGYSGEGNRELVRGLVQRLRSKVEPNPHNPKFILTEPGIGYYFIGNGDQVSD